MIDSKFEPRLVIKVCPSSHPSSESICSGGWWVESSIGTRIGTWIGTWIGVWMVQLKPFLLKTQAYTTVLFAIGN